MPKEDEKKEDEKLIPVGDGVETSDEPSKDPVKGDRDEEVDEKVGHSEEEDLDEDAEENGEEISPERRKLREQRKAAKKRKQQRIASDARELAFLRSRNEEIEKQLSKVVLRQNNIENASVDQRIGTLESQIREAEAIHTEAVKNADGSTATEALRVATQLREAATKLKSDKETRSTRATEEQEAAKRGPQSPDPDAVANGKAWIASNEWFDPTLNDEDSFIVRAMEEKMAREGRFNPATTDYWEELDRRIAKRMPHLKKAAKEKEVDGDLDWDDDDEKPAPKPKAKKPSGPRIAVGGKTRSLRPGEVYISEQRKKALQEAGVWEDDEKRERYLKSYKQWDDEAARNS